MAVEYTLYNYPPSLAAAAVIFIILFAVSSIAHVIQLTMKKNMVLHPLPLSPIEAVGYVGRAMNPQDKAPNWSINAYIIQSILLLTGPTFFAASIYMILGRIIRLTKGESHSVVHATWITKIFAGGGLLAKAKDQDAQELGEHVILGGLIVQILFFGFFVIASGLFHYRIRAFLTLRSQTFAVPWQRYLIILYVANSLILWRSGSHGSLQMHEVYLYVFDALLMLITCIVFNTWHPSTIISHKSEAVPQEEMEFSS
ncbi:RTA1 like protein-domain-containing protein [Phyllosticta citriasiana]|uniref:RTA1 like protein-domain-containing protein n=1 Tax=Phyllosticta citriasiana TaxID=595635 RepID=UPI0030FD72FF